MKEEMFLPYMYALEQVPDDTIRKIAQLLADTVEAGGRIFLAGNGGSSCIAQHMASDLMKAVGEQKTHSCQAFCLTGNVALITALSNDMDYDDIFSVQAGYYGLCQDDVVIGFSVSGRSKNIERLFELAYIRNTYKVMITGSAYENIEYPQFGDSLFYGYLSVDTCLDKKTPLHYYVCESVFSCIAHAIANEFHILRGNYDAEG